MNPFILDSNFFIEAHRAIYPFDVVPSFWNKKEQIARKGFIISIDKVKQEIFKNEDELAEWCQKYLPGDFFRDSSVAISEYSRIAD